VGPATYQHGSGGCRGLRRLTRDVPQERSGGVSPLRDSTAPAAHGRGCAEWTRFARIRLADHAWVAKLVDARDLRKLSTRLGNGRREWGQSRWNSSTSGWLQYRAKHWPGGNLTPPRQRKCRDLTAPA
jgi:hypothetical protein